MDASVSGAKTARGVLQDEPPGILHRIQQIYYFPADLPETHPAVWNRPWVPHAGGQDDGSLHKPAQKVFKS